MFHAELPRLIEGDEICFVLWNVEDKTEVDCRDHIKLVQNARNC